MELIFKKLTRKNVSLVVYVLVGFFVLLKETVYYPDSYAFLKMSFNRSPLYSSFLKVMTTIFGDSFELPTKIIQYGLLVLAVYSFLRFIERCYSLNRFGMIMLQLVLLSPCLYFYYVSSTLLSEALAYPLVILIVVNSIKMVVSGNLKLVFKLLSLLFICILVRGQFIAFLPVIALLVLYIVLKTRIGLEKVVLPLVCILILPLLTGQVERGYNKLVHRNYVSNSMNYVHFISSMFYLADESDFEAFESKEAREYFVIVHKSLTKAGLTKKESERAKVYDYYDVFVTSFSRICNRRVHELGLKYFEEKGLNYYDQNIELNKLCANMLFPLWKRNFKKWIGFYFRGLKVSFGSFKQMLLFLLLLISGLMGAAKSKVNNDLFSLVAVSTLFMFANNTLITLVVHPIKRYVFYFDWVIFAIIILLLNEVLKKQINGN
ncbi:hypothetical protein VOI54_07635 [Tamlana sp. 2201CG12-4]|uniref:hypothetical protein n=1 Tax=Tamlana sp. 2201CG12-4 TaxID=3112582 RepID=UPI002DBAECE8|nr:hypothetical protein [Tamlana sp. 2201CG12-4]MEC3906886.1 hypothetical protein [Tamlana sp. 2201CG12-4]